MNPDPESEEYLVESQVKSRLHEMNEEMLPLISELIRVAKSSSDPTNSVIFQKLLLGHTIHSTASNEKFGLRLSLGLFRLPSQTSDTSEIFGE
jgi:hypothetical protein